MSFLLINKINTKIFIKLEEHILYSYQNFDAFPRSKNSRVWIIITAEQNRLKSNPRAV